MSYLLVDGNATRVKDAYGLTEFPGISVNGEISNDIDLRLRPVVRNGVLVYDPTDANHPRGEILVRKKKKSTHDTFNRINYWNRPDLDLQGSATKTHNLQEIDISHSRNVDSRPLRRNLVTNSGN